MDRSSAILFESIRTERALARDAARSRNATASRGSPPRSRAAAASPSWAGWLPPLRRPVNAAREPSDDRPAALRGSRPLRPGRAHGPRGAGLLRRRGARRPGRRPRPLHAGRARVPFRPDAVAASLGCGNPTAVADLQPGETVLDLGSGGGIDVLLAARRVAPGGMAYGLDMTDEMLTLARRNAAEAGVENATVREGRDRGDPAPRRVRRRRDQQLRDQPLHREAARLRRDRARASAGRSPGRERRRGRRRPVRLPIAPSAATSRAASPGPCRSASTRPGSRRPAWPRSA